MTILPFCFHHHLRWITLMVSLLLLQACTPDQQNLAVSQNTPPPLSEESEDTAKTTSSVSGATIPSSQLVTLIQDDISAKESKLDPSQAFRDQKSEPVTVEPDLEILNQEIFGFSVDNGLPLATLQPETPTDIDEVDTAIEWIFNGNPIPSLSSDAPVLDAGQAPQLGETPLQEENGIGDLPANAFAVQDSTNQPVGEESFDFSTLEQVFAIINKSDLETVAIPAPSRFPPKSDGVQRAAVLLPLTGPYRQLGADLRNAVDMAVISLARPNFEVIFIDTANDARAAASEAVAAGANVIIGPLFSSQTAEVAPLAAEYNIPILSFSNNSSISAPGVWILGQQPEQELDAVLSYGLASLTALEGISRENIRVAVVTSDTAYGHKLRDFSLRRLDEFGVTQVSRLLLDQSMLDAEARLRQTIRQFTRWSKESPDPIYDMVIIAGDADFTLRVAPVLVWHDLDPKKVRFIGPSQWSRTDTISEPSLQGGLYATVPRDRRLRFQAAWQKYFGEVASELAPLGFDAVAVASLLQPETAAEDILLRPTGFAGFSGVFRLYPDGSNRRQFEVRIINNGKSTVVRPADKSF